MKKLFILHFILLLLAISNFTIITFWFNQDWSLALWNIAQKDSFGVPYKFDYSLELVLTYIGVYFTGFLFYLKWSLGGAISLRRFSMLICILGLASFSLELLHWIVDFNFSLIVSFPVILLLSAIYFAFKIVRVQEGSIGDL